MTRRNSLQCVHEPFGDAFYYGPERLSSRFETDEKGRVESGFEDSTFKTVLDRIEKEGAEVRITPPCATSCHARPSSPLHSLASRCGVPCSEPSNNNLVLYVYPLPHTYPFRLRVVADSPARQDES